MSEVDQTKPDYSLRFLKNPKWLLGLLGLFALTFVSQMSLFSSSTSSAPNAAPVAVSANSSGGLEGLLKRNLAANRACPVNFDKLSYKWNGIILSNVKVSPICTKGVPVHLKTLTIALSGFSFSPLGPAFNISTNFQGMPLEADIAFGLGGLAVVMENQAQGGSFAEPEKKIVLGKLAGLIPIKLGGDLYISHFHMKSNLSFTEMEIFSLNIVSKNLTIPAQKMKLPPMGLPFSIEEPLDINNFLILGELTQGGKKPKFKLRQFTIGDDQSPLRTEFKGNIDVNLIRPVYSGLNLVGELKLADSFPQKELLHNLILQKFDQKDGFYQIQIKGAGMPALMGASSPR
ncbi:MAG: hypothetical protein CME65_00440 [Halobacteriovoraceae bacterium]|nr:hypothetical protein [Halobacteriovoraceae bacterium]|tara:strand:+ start:8844 stop:9878 length:1035 start_codon:yes stop_codon:yes gene_type:complete